MTDGRIDRLFRLPIPVRPAHHETLTSYVARLATVHALPYASLWHQLSTPAGPAVRRLIILDRLAAVTGRPADDLQQALPELRDPAPDWRAFRHLPQPGCPRCTGSHPGGPVWQLHAHHHYVCTRHGYWIGPAHPGLTHTPPRPLAGLTPDLVAALVAAQHRHDRLVHRHGWPAVFAAIDTSTTACLDHQTPDSSRYREVWRARLAQLIPHPRDFATTVYLAAFYPEIVRHAAVSTATAPAVTPFHTYPTTRRAGTLDGTPTGTRTETDQQLARKAHREFREHGWVPGWAIPRNTQRASPAPGEQLLSG